MPDKKNMKKKIFCALLYFKGTLARTELSNTEKNMHCELYTLGSGDKVILKLRI